MHPNWRKSCLFIMKKFWMKLCHSPFFWLGLLYFFTAKGHLEIIDTEYSLRTAVAIIEDGSMLIEPPNSSVLLNTPVIESDGKIYSQYGIGILGIFIPLIWVAKIISSLFIQDESLVTNFLLSFYNIPFALLGLWHFKRILEHLGQGKEKAEFLMICLGICTIFWKYVVTDFSEVTQIAFLLGAVSSCILKEEKNRWLKVSAYLSLLILMKLVYVVILPPFIILAVKNGIKHKTITKNILAGIVLLFPTAILLMYVNWIRFGSILQSGYGNHQSAFSLHYLSRDCLDYIISLDRGIFPYTPLILFIPIFLKKFYAKDKSSFFLIFSICTIFYLMSASWIGWKGGYCWGNRTLVPVVPLLLTTLAYMDWGKKWQQKILLLLILISLPIQIIAVSLKTYEWSILHIKLQDLTDTYYGLNELEGSIKLFVEKLRNASGIYETKKFITADQQTIDLTNYESFNGYNYWLVHGSKLFLPNHTQQISLITLLCTIFLCMFILWKFNKVVNQNQ